MLLSFQIGSRSRILKLNIGKGKTAIVGGLSPFHSFRRIFLNDFLVTAQFL